MTELQVLHEHCFDPHSRLIADIDFLVEIQIPKVLKWDVPKAWEHLHAETSNIDHIYINISRQFFDWFSTSHYCWRGLASFHYKEMVAYLAFLSRDFIHLPQPPHQTVPQCFYMFLVSTCHLPLLHRFFLPKNHQVVDQTLKQLPEFNADEAASRSRIKLGHESNSHGGLMMVTLPETNSEWKPLKIGRNPIGKDHIPTIHF